MEVKKRICDLCHEEVTEWSTIVVKPLDEQFGSSKIDVCYKQDCLNSLPSKVKEVAEQFEAETAMFKERLVEIAEKEKGMKR